MESELPSVIGFGVWVAVDLVAIDASLVMFCWLTEPLGRTDRVSDVGVVSSSFVLLGNLSTALRFRYLAFVLIRLSTGWTPPSETQHGFSRTNENVPAMTIRLFDCFGRRHAARVDRDRVS